MPAWRVGESTYIERVYTRRPRGDLVEPAVIARQQIRPSVIGRVVDAKSRNSSVSSVSLCPLCRTQRPTARDDVMQERSRRVDGFLFKHRGHRDTEDTENMMNNLEDNDTLTQRIIGCAIEVHRTLGPGLLESAYEQCMAHEMTLQDIAFRLQVPTPIEYKGLRLDCAYKADVVVQERVIVELKSVEALTTLHHAQLLTYMKVSRAEIGLLINFNIPRLIDGVKRFRI